MCIRDRCKTLGTPLLTLFAVAAEEQDAHIVADAEQHGPEGRRHEVEAAQDPAHGPQRPEHPQEQRNHHEAIARQSAEPHPVDDADENKGCLLYTSRCV